MNIILVEKQEVQGDRVHLLGRRAEHMIKVLHVQIGDTVRMGLIDGPKGSGVVLSLRTRFPFQVELQTHFSDILPERPPIDLLLALPRPIMLKRIFSQAAALGVGSIFVIHAQRVEKSFWNATLLGEAEYRPLLVQGLEQAVDTRVPEVCMYQRFKPFIEDILPSRCSHYSHLLIAHPASSAFLPTVITTLPERILLAVGPEGGWVDYELERFAECGFVPFTIGERILKVDTAVVAIHSRVMAYRHFLASAGES